ncbi:MAG: hypothetical protein WCI61_08560, partial [Chloroflexota bacterium]
MSRHSSTYVLTATLLAALALFFAARVPVRAAPGGTYIGTSMDITTGLDGRSVSIGYTVPSPRDGCASTIQAFNVPLTADASGFRVDRSRSGVLAGRPTPDEEVSIIGMFDGFTQYAAAGVIFTTPVNGSTCAPLMRVFRAVGEGVPGLGTNVFAVDGTASLVTDPSATGTVSISVNAKGDSIEAFSVAFRRGECVYDRSTRMSDYGVGTESPLLLNGPSFSGATGFGAIAGVTYLGGARGALLINGTGSCPTVALTFTTGAPVPAPTASAAPAATPTATPTPSATPA